MKLTAIAQPMAKTALHPLPPPVVRRTEVTKGETINRKGPGGRTEAKKTTTVEKKGKAPSPPPKKAAPTTDKKKGHSRGPSAFGITVAWAGPPAEIRAGNSYPPRRPAQAPAPQSARPNAGRHPRRAPVDRWASHKQTASGHPKRLKERCL